MKTKFIQYLWFLLVMLAFGCAEDPVNSETSEDLNALLKTSPDFMKAQHNGFTSPLFDLATAPNGEILVADAGSGIYTKSGSIDISLPGVTAISPIGRGSMWAAVSAGTATEEDNGQALYRTSKGESRKLVNLFQYEEENNPDGADINSNPYSVASLGGGATLLVDAGANDLLKIDDEGEVELIAVFPPELVSTANIKSLAQCSPDAVEGFCGLPPQFPAQAVPTSVVVGPDGYYYVGELKGFPGPVNESNIWKISPNASNADCGNSPDCMKLFDGGFTSIVDLAFGPDGRLYVVEFDEFSWAAVEIFGSVTGGSIKACDTATLECEIIASGIPVITAITFDKKGNLWATRSALVPGAAEVFQVQ